MKTNSLLILSFLLLTSCATTKEENITRIRLATYSAASIGTVEALHQRPDWRPAFELAYQSLDKLVESKTVTGEDLRVIIAQLPVKELKSDTARIAIDGATMLFDVTISSKINLEKQQYILAAATGIRDGLGAGLGIKRQGAFHSHEDYTFINSSYHYQLIVPATFKTSINSLRF